MIARLVLLLLAVAVVVAEAPYLSCPRVALPVAPPGPFTLAFLVVFALGLVARFQRAHRDPNRELQRRRARLWPRRWADDIPRPTSRRQRDPDPALPFNDRKRER